VNNNGDLRVRSRLRWQLFAAWTVLLVGSMGAVFFAMALKMSSLIFHSEVEKLHPAARGLREVCAEHFMSPSERELTAKFARIMKEFPDLAYLLFVDAYGNVHCRGANKAIDSLKLRLAKLDPSEKDENLIRVGGETYVDIREVTDTRPSLPVHVGFAKSLTNAKTWALLWNRGAIALVVLAGGLVGGFLFLTWVARPVVDVSNQAERLSLGDMDVRLDLKCRGEIGRVYLSLERLRESVMYAFRRLNNTEQTMEETVEQKPPEEEELAKGDRRWPKVR